MQRTDRVPRPGGAHDRPGPLYFDEQCNSYRVRPGFRFPALDSRQSEQPQPEAVNVAEPAAPSCSPEQLADLSLEAAQRMLNDAGELVAILDRLRSALTDRPGFEVTAERKGTAAGSRFPRCHLWVRVLRPAR